MSFSPQYQQAIEAKQTAQQQVEQAAVAGNGGTVSARQAPPASQAPPTPAS
jgi:hypothetical protein